MQLHEGDFAELEILAQDINARMNEQLFVKRLLPHLIPPETPTGRPVDLSIWVAATGNPQRLLDVIDNKGNVLFTVPPILARSPTAIPEKEIDPDNDLGEIGAVYDARIGTMPAHVVNDWYYNSLIQRSYSPEQSLVYLYARMWITIYRRYNIPLERLFGEKAAQIDGVIPDDKKPETEVVLQKDTFSDAILDDEDFDPM